MDWDPHVGAVLSAVRRAGRRLGLVEDLTVVGSAAACLCTKKCPEDVGDVDILLEPQAARRYWELADALFRERLRPVYDVIESPEGVPWNPWERDAFAHGLALRLAPIPGVPDVLKHRNLDLCVSPDTLELIPHSAVWVYRISKGPDWRAGFQYHRDSLVADLRRRDEDAVSGGRRFAPELGLYAALL